MCRWIAYRGETIPLERYVTAPAHSLVVQSLQGQGSRSAPPTATASASAGTASARSPASIARSARPGRTRTCKHLCRHIRSPLFFAHVRAATGTPTTRPNCHPFVHGNWMFMHNGQVGDWSLIRRRVEELIPDEFYKSRIGTTDSEAVFLAILGAGAERDPIAATMRTLATLTELVSTSGTTEPLRFTAALADGRDLYAFRYAYGARPTRCTTARPATTSSWCRSRSTWSASSGSRCRPAI